MTAPEVGQRWALEVYPTADEEYTISLSYSISPSALTGASRYAYGGAAHTETIIGVKIYGWKELLAHTKQ